MENNIHVPLSMAQRLQARGYQALNPNPAEMSYLNISIGITTCVVSAPISTTKPHPAILPMPTVQDVIDWFRKEFSLVINCTKSQIDDSAADRWVWVVEAYTSPCDAARAGTEGAPEPWKVWKTISDSYALGCYNALDYALQHIEKGDSFI